MFYFYYPLSVTKSIHHRSRGVTGYGPAVIISGGGGGASNIEANPLDAHLINPINPTGCHLINYSSAVPLLHVLFQ